MISDLCSFWDTVINTGSTPTCLKMFQSRHWHEHWQHTNMSQPVPTETLSWELAAHQQVSTCSNWDIVKSTGSTPTCLNLFQLRLCHENWQHTNMSQPVPTETLSRAPAAHQHVSTCSNWDTVKSTLAAHQHVSTCSNWDTVMRTGSTPTCLYLFQLALQTAKSYLNITNSLTCTNDVIWDHKSSSIFKFSALTVHNLITLFRTVCQKLQHTSLERLQASGSCISRDSSSMDINAQTSGVHT
jgi:hypothetical protein